jgi:hypothetical protein
MRNGFKMKRVNAVSHSAHMIEFKADRNISLEELIGNAMRLLVLEVAIAVLKLAAMPEPARISYLNLERPSFKGAHQSTFLICCL